MSELLSAISLVFSAILTHVGEVLALFSTEPILQLMLGIMVFGAVIGLGLRLIRH